MDIQSKVIYHMNKDHKLALEDFLAVYGGVDINDNITKIKLKSIELDHMEISFNQIDINSETVRSISIDPPLQDFSQASPTLIGMAKFAAEKRGYSYLQIQDITYPNTIMEYILLPTLIIICLFGSLCPDIVYPYLLNHVLPTALSNWLYNYNKFISLTAITIHLIDLKMVLLPKLNHYRVPANYKAQWILFCFLESRFTIKRFERLVDK